MDLLKKIIFLHMLHCAIADFLPKMDETAHMSTEWNQSLLMTMKWIPQPNNRELFYDIWRGENSHSLAAIQWNSPIGENPGGFNLTTITHNFDGTVKDSQTPCLIPAGEDIQSLILLHFRYLRSNRVLVYFKKEHKTKGPIQIPQIINPESCKIEDSVNIEPYIGFSPISIVPFKNTFDIIFYNQTLCPEDWWCKMTFDHDGKKISEPNSLFKDTQSIMYIDRIYPMSYESGKEGFVVVTKKKDFPDKQSAVYSPVRGWLPAGNLKEDNHFYSNSNGYAIICWQTNDLKNIKCLWLDESHKDKKLDELLTISLNDRTLQIPYVSISPTGKIVMLKEGLDNGKKVVFSDTITPDDKCKRHGIIEFTNELKRIELSIINLEKSCLSLVTKDPMAISQKVYSFLYAYKFETKCVKFPKDFVPEDIVCGKDYIFS